MQTSAEAGHRKLAFLTKMAPAIFVLLWATGFVGAKFGMRDAEPFIFLAYRFWITTIILAPVVYWLMRSTQPDFGEVLHSLITGCLIHGAYLGGVFFAIDRGLAAGLSSLIVSLQPFLTVFLAALLLSEKIGKMRLLFFFVALLGVVLVLSPSQVGFEEAGINQETLIPVIIATFSISIGSVYQKRFVKKLNLVATTGFQFFGAAIMVSAISLFFEQGEITWTRDLVLTMAWLVLVLSIGAVGLLMFLIRAGSSASVASLFFMVPVVAMFMTWVLFDENLSTIQLLGSALVVVSVGLASRLKT